jgi:hypothetical protein
MKATSLCYSWWVRSINSSINLLQTVILRHRSLLSALSGCRLSGPQWLTAFARNMAPVLCRGTYMIFMDAITPGGWPADHSVWWLWTSDWNWAESLGLGSLGHCQLLLNNMFCFMLSTAAATFCKPLLTFTFYSCCSRWAPSCDIGIIVTYHCIANHFGKYGGNCSLRESGFGHVWAKPCTTDLLQHPVLEALLIWCVRLWGRQFSLRLDPLESFVQCFASLAVCREIWKKLRLQ